MIGETHYWKLDVMATTGSTVEVWLLKKSYCMGYEEKFLHGLLLLLTECTKQVSLSSTGHGVLLLLKLKY